MKSVDMKDVQEQILAKIDFDKIAAHEDFGSFRIEIKEEAILAVEDYAEAMGHEDFDAADNAVEAFRELEHSGIISYETFGEINDILSLLRQEALNDQS